MPVLGTRGDALGEGAAPFRGEMPPLMLVNSAKRVVPDAHDGEVSSVCVDGDHCVTAGWDGQLRFWAKYDALPTRSFQLVQRAQAHEDAVKTVATIADKWVISAGLNGLCRVWTRSGEAAMHPSQIPEPTPNEKPGDEKPNGEDRAPPPPKHPLPLDDLGDDNAEEVGLEMEELRLARTERKRVLAQYDGPWKCVGAFDGGAGGCVNAVVGLHAPEDAGCVAKPPAIALAVGSHLGSMTHAVRILDPTRNWATIQVLEHPEGVTRLLRKVGCELDGLDRLVTGCLDGRIRVYARDPAEPDPRPPPVEPVEGEDEASGAGAGAGTGEGGDEGGEEQTSTPEPEPEPWFPPYRLEATLHAHPTVVDIQWLGEHPAFPPPQPPAPPAPPPKEGGQAGEGDEDADEPVEPPGPPEFWPGCDSHLWLVSVGTDGGVKLWERRRVPTKPWGLPHWGYEPPPEPPKGEAKEYAWCRTPGPDGEIRNAPIAPRIRIANDESSKIESLAKARLTCVRVWREHVTVGLGDGRMCTWGRRVRDESGVEGWVLERITPAPADTVRCGAVTGMYECGHNLLVTHADGQARVYA